VLLASRLEPSVEDVVYFPDLNHSTMPYAIKQMIAHEVEMEVMRRKEGPEAAAPVAKAEVAKPEDKPKKAGEGQMRSVEEVTKKLQAKDVEVR
jgi:hypothetical protein